MRVCLYIIALFCILVFSDSAQAATLNRGPHLFLDETLIAGQANLQRQIAQPARYAGNPTIDAVNDHSDTPYVTVMRDPATGRYRVWYDAYAQPFERVQHIGYMESTDALNWQRPHTLLADPAPMTWPGNVVDRGPIKDSQRRYLLVWFSVGDTPTSPGNIWIAGSPDGKTFTPISSSPALTGTGDIVTLAQDTRGGWILLVKVWKDYPEGPRRSIAVSHSKDLLTWTTPRNVVDADDQDPGKTEFYGIGGVTRRGDMLVGLLRVLRDDLTAEGATGTGMGWTTLAWSKDDGATWQRDREPLLAPDPAVGSWDHSMAWGSSINMIGRNDVIYYGGYPNGHKTDRYTGRQLGAAMIGHDRFVGYSAAAAEGQLTTTPMTLANNVSELQLNAKVTGTMTVEVLDAQGQPIDGYRLAIPRGDYLQRKLSFDQPLAALAGQTLSLRFTLQNAAVYAFYAPR